MNDIAKSVIQKQMGSHLEFVFVYRGHPVSKLNDSAFKNARAGAAKKLPNIKNASIHSLKHTYGARLRVAGVSEGDPNSLTGHKGRMSMTTYYSAPELRNMLEYSNRVCQQNDNLALLKHRTG